MNVCHSAVLGENCEHTVHCLKVSELLEVTTGILVSFLKFPWNFLSFFDFLPGSQLTSTRLFNALFHVCQAD